LPQPDTTVRVRFAPSPTGYPHLGNIRTALFNWLFARHSGGTFLLRIEDTDMARKVEGATEIIMDSLRWMGLNWDEGPFFQSQRLPMYKAMAEKLIREGNAYYCYCSPERLDAMRQEQTKQKQPPGYDRHCRDLSDEEKQRMAASGIVPVVRFKFPREGTTSFQDLIRSEINFENSTIDDFVLLKSDGYPTYHLANIVDDHDMKITHVIRGDEWVSSTPRHVMLYKAAGWEPPKFAHLPMILGSDRSKLSKRHGATSIKDYRDQGFLPQTMINFLTLLGWSLDDKTEIMSREDIVKNFSLDRISKTAAVFNKEKLEWMNGVYIRTLPVEELAQQVMPYLDHDLPILVKRPVDINYVKQIIPLIQERAKTLAEVPSLVDFMFTDLEYDSNLLLNKIEKPDAVNAIKFSIARLASLSDWKTESMEHAIRPLAEELKLKTGVFFGVIRVAVTGRTVSPPLFQTMEVLGREESFKRLNSALNKLDIA
jgi:glutamyl-tRNA synthetase